MCMAQRIKQRRISMGYTQDELAELKAKEAEE